MSDQATYPRKYWWAVLVVVPLVAAVLAVVPSIMGVLKPSSTSPSVGTYIANASFFSDMYFVTQVSGQGGAANTQELHGQLEQALRLAQGKNYASAIELLQQVAAKYPSAAILNDLGLLYAYKGDIQKAQEVFQAALKMQPNDEAANLNLGILLKPSNPTEAAAFVAKAPHLVAARVSPTPPTPAPAAPTPSASSSGAVLARSPTQIPGVRAELFEFTRFQNTITARVRLINSSAKDQTLPYNYGPFYGGYVPDEASGKRYATIAQGIEGYVTVPANGSLEIWAKFSLPSEERPQYLSLVGTGMHFDNVAIQLKP